MNPAHVHLFLFAVISLLFSGCMSTPRQLPSSVHIQEIKPGYIEEKSFKRIGEYFTGREVTGNRMILRSIPEQRSGYYFTLILDKNIRKLPPDTLIIGEFFIPGSLDLQTHEWKLPAKRPCTKEILTGLTGKDWPGGSDAPSAWRFTIQGPEGDLLAEKRSFLWSF